MKRTLPLVLLVAACGDGVQRHSGLDGLLQVADAQYFVGALPSSVANGPSIGALRVVSQTVRVGQTNRALSGSVSKDAVSLAFSLDGDPGYWVRPAGGADPILADSLSFDANLAFSRFVTAGVHDLHVAASNAQGQWGAIEPLQLTFVDVNAVPPADLQVRLSWDVDADLDLHVIEPDGVEIWSRKITAYEPPVVGPVDQAAADAAGRLDFDSNGSCRIDGRRVESVLYGAAPKGTYTVRVDTFSLCGQSAARWRVEVLRAGEIIATQTGLTLPTDTRFPHERGAGALAVQFTLP